MDKEIKPSTAKLSSSERNLGEVRGAKRQRVIHNDLVSMMQILESLGSIKLFATFLGVCPAHYLRATCKTCFAILPEKMLRDIWDPLVPVFEGMIAKLGGKRKAAVFKVKRDKKGVDTILMCLTKDGYPCFNYNKEEVPNYDELMQYVDCKLRAEFGRIMDQYQTLHPNGRMLLFRYNITRPELGIELSTSFSKFYRTKDFLRLK